MLPERIGRYEVRDVAGSGGFATVFEGFDPRLNARVAIKVLADNKSRDPETRRRFRQEAVLMRRLGTESDVPGLVEVFDIDETEGGQPFFVMGWADRGTVGDRRGDAPWSASDVHPLIMALTQTLGHLHAEGVVHRDIKPQNLLLRAGRNAAKPETGRIVEGEQILVGDLGLAKDLAHDTSAMSLVAGTERYMAPEQLVYGGSVDHRADVFAASRMIEELLRGPHGQEELPAPLRTVINRGVAHDRDDRHGSMEEWQKELLAALFPVEPATTVDKIEPAPTADDVAGPTLTPPPIPVRDAGGPAGSAPQVKWGVLAALFGAVAVLVVLAWVVLAGSTSPIEGPDSIVSGERAVYTADGLEDVRWVHPDGTSVFESSLVITGRLPGEVRVTAVADGERYERTVAVEPAQNGPVILGPEVVTLGQVGTYRASVASGDSYYWIHPELGRVDAEEVAVEQLGEGFVVGVIAVSPDGTERGQQLRVGAP